MELLPFASPVISHSSLIRRITLILVVVYVVFCLIGAILMIFIVENRLTDKHMRLMAQTEASIDGIHTTVQLISNQLMQDPRAIAYLYERNQADYDAVAISALLADYVKKNGTLIRYIGLYNGYLGTYETSVGTLPAGQMGLPVSTSQFSLRPREIKLEGTAIDELKNEFARLVVYYARIDNNPQRTNHGLVVTHINVATYLKLFENYPTDTKIYLTDANGIVYASNQPDAFITDLSFAGEFTPIFKPAGGAGTASGQGAIRSGSLLDRKLILYRQSKISGLNEVLVISFPMILNEFMISYLPLIFIGLMLLFLVIWMLREQMTRFYKPIQTLIHQVSSDDPEAGGEYDALHKALILGDQAGRIAREKYLYDLLVGNPNHADAERIGQILTELAAPAYLLVIARFDGFADLSELNGQNLESFRFVIINITQEILTEYVPTTGVVTANNEVTLILQLREPVIPDNLEDALANAQSQIRRYFPFTVTMAYENPTENYSQFSLAYQQTTALFSYRLYFGPNSILSPPGAMAINKIVRYPVMAEKRILEALNLRRQDLLQAGIDEFIQTISAGYSPRISNYFSQLLFSVFKQVDNTIELVDEDYDNYTETNSRLMHSDQFDQARQIITRFCLELMTLSQEKTRNATVLKHERLQEELIKFLRDNLADPSLSLESAAEHFHLSTGYLGKLVRAASGETFSNLLSSMRLDKAAELLINTNQPAYRVAEQVGIPNVAYFSTLFKRQFGLSPAPFREKRENLQNNSTQ